MVLARSCALTAVSLFLATGLERKPNTVRQQLREFCYEAKAKRGGPRQELHVESCFAPLLAWVLSWWDGTQLALAVDATTLGQRFVVLVVSVVYRGCAIPVAWTVLPATEQHAWRGEWLRMLRQVRAVVPRGFFVIVLADRGLYARWLFQRIVRLGWHPVLRINTGGTFRPAKSVPISRSVSWCLRLAGSGWARAPRFRGHAGASIARCSRGGTKAIAIPGCCLPISRPVRAKRVGTAYARGLNRASKSRNVGAGSGSARA